MDRKRILIVDDELDVRIYVATLFETSGYATATTCNGKQGLGKAREIAPDLIILDVMMPESGGAAMYRELKKDSQLKKIPVIMLTAVGENSFLHYLKMLTVHSQESIPPPEAYMEKPLDHEKLLKLAETLLS